MSCLELVIDNTKHIVVFLVQKNCSSIGNVTNLTLNVFKSGIGAVFMSGIGPGLKKDGMPPAPNGPGPPGGMRKRARAPISFWMFIRSR